jgi:hypothetical protein
VVAAIMLKLLGFSAPDLLSVSLDILFNATANRGLGTHDLDADRSYSWWYRYNSSGLS